MPRRPTLQRARNRRSLAVYRATVARRRRHRSAGALGVVLTLAIVGAIALFWGGTQVALAVLDSTMGQLPDARPLHADSMLYDRSGALIADIHQPGETRIPVRLDQIAPAVQQATVAIEDRNFWSEGAVDPPRIVAAGLQDLVHKDAAQGASTITEQLAKVLYLDSSKSLDRKVRQLFIARRLDATMTKRQILEQYLNDIYYGHGATGIEAAAHVYFDTDALHLSVAQASLLAGLPNQPANLDPLLHLDAARVRQAQVLAAMVTSGAITASQADAARAEPLHLGDGHADDLDRYPILTSRVVAEVRSQVLLDARVAGLRITSTVDSALQDYAQHTVTSQVDGIRGLNVSDGALVAVDPPSGEVLAYVGSAGPGHPASLVDIAHVPREPGSTMKLFTYSTAFAEHKVDMLTPIDDAPLTLPKGGGPDGEEPYQVHNYDQRYHGVLPVEEALGNSLNIPAVKVELMAGVPNVVAMARSLGVTTLTEPATSYGASLTLGAYGVPLEEMAQAATVFADQGTLHHEHLLRSVRTGDGRELLPAPPAAKPVLDPGVAFIMNNILTTDSNRVMEFGAHSALTLDGHLVAAKTGTTNDFRDNLTVGWTPHLAVATWVGNADDAPMRGTTGITGAAPIWHQVMQHALRGVPDDWPPPPPDIKPIHEGGRDGYGLVGAQPQAQSGTTNVHYSGDCRSWTYNGANYWFCGGGMSGLPGDPGPQGGGGAPPPPAPAPYQVFPHHKHG